MENKYSTVFFDWSGVVAAVKAALVEGIVPGGGVTLVNLATKYAIKSEDAAIAAGEKLLVEALQKPFAILLKNSGLNADEWLPQVKSAKTGYGIDVTNPTKLVDRCYRSSTSNP